MNIKIIPIFEDIEKMSKKKKFKNFFDIVVCGFITGNCLLKEYMDELINKDSVIFLEKANHFANMTKESKAFLNK